MPTDRDDEMLKNWRGRRFLACRAVERMDQIIQHLGEEDGTELPPSLGEFNTPPSDPVRLEMQNAAANLLRLILAHNDRGCSPDKLNRF